MKSTMLSLGLLFLLSGMSLFSCKSDQSAAAAAAAEVEVARLDSVTRELDQIQGELESNKKAVKQSIEELDAILKEGENK